MLLNEEQMLVMIDTRAFNQDSDGKLGKVPYEKITSKTITALVLM